MSLPRLCHAAPVLAAVKATPAGSAWRPALTAAAVRHRITAAGTAQRKDSQHNKISKQGKPSLYQTRGGAYHGLAATPGWGVTRAAGYAAAPGPPARWGNPATVYRAAGLTPALCAPAGRRRAAPSAAKAQPTRAVPCSAWAPDWGTKTPPRLRRHTARTRPTRRHHRRCPRPPRREDRLRDGPRPTPLRPSPPEPTKGTFLHHHHHHRRRWQA
jgi:hypothetical protein